MIYKDLIKKIDDMENLREVDNIKCTTDIGECTIENSKKGYLTNVNIQGKTLVNLANPNNIYTTDGVRYNNPFRYIESGKTYTFMNLCDKQIKYTYGGIGDITIPPHSKVLYTIPNNDITIEEIVCYGHIQDGWVETDADKQKISKAMLVLEGDYTNEDIEYFKYFDGLQSVGQGDNIKLLSYQGENLFDGTYQDGYFNGNSLDEELIQGMPCITTNWIECNPNLEYYFFGGNRKQIQFKNENNIFKSVILNSNNFETPTDCTHFRLYYARTDQFYSPLNIYKKGDIKTIPYELRNLPSGIKDEIVYKNNSYKLIQRCEEIVFNGNENWIEVHGMYEFRLNLDISVLRLDMSKFITNLYKQSHVDYIFNVQTESALSISTENGIGVIDIVDTSISPFSIANFKEKLKKNPLKIIYELETPREIELGLLNLEQYDNQTRFICNSGIVIPNISFESTQNLGSHIEAIRDNIKNYNVRTDFPFSINFLNGWQPYLGYASSVGNYCTNNNFVTINATINGGVTTAGTIIGKIPSKYAPRKNIIVIFQTTDGKYYNGIIRTNGEIEIYYNDITYRSWLYLYVNYLI
ncbi:TPA: hypothetical protein KOC79_002478 [Clostridioides difficile]|nr:hypothetical protein [Clostridioides difficile]